eukprot:m.337760 g.337760  ORF g.337760 m.337760 type:complete len:63 (-) comp18226_c0_seq1:2177-2365(-)
MTKKNDNFDFCFQKREAAPESRGLASHSSPCLSGLIRLISSHLPHRHLTVVAICVVVLLDAC